jgi:hypothetical protein
VTVTIGSPGESARLTFDGVAGQRVSLRISDVTIGTSCCSSAALSISGPDGTVLLAPSGVGTRGGFVDTRTLPLTGSYRVVVDPQGDSVGSATLTLYDVPPDTEGAIVAGGGPISVETTSPARMASLTFDGAVGDRVSLKLDDVTIGLSCCSSAKVSILKPDGTTLLSATNFGTNGGFIDTKTTPVTGSVPDRDRPAGETPSAASTPRSTTCRPSPRTIVPGRSARLGRDDRPGQNASFASTALRAGASASSSRT